MKALCAFLLGSMWLAMTPAHADVYGYIDEHGNAHFATVKVDERYQLFMRGDGPFDSDKMTEPVAPSPSASSTPLFQYLSTHPNLKKFEPLLLQAASEFGVDVALLKAVMAAESGFDPMAVSPKGAVGLMQVMPATAERFGLQGDKKKSVAQKLTDPKTNIRLGARYLSLLGKLYPNQQHLVLASYNAGEGAVQKYNNAIPPYPETRNYVKLVTDFYHLYKPAPPRAVGSGLVRGTPGSRRVQMTIPAPDLQLP